MGAGVLFKRLGIVAALAAAGFVTGPVLGGDQPAWRPEHEGVHLDVPYVPTQEDAVTAMLKLAKVTDKDYVMDLGCGDGRIVVAAAKDFKARGFGVDIDPERIKESNENATKAGVTERAKFKLQDIFVTDVSEASVVTLFLLESVNLKLRPQLMRQLKPGSRVVSNTFTMGEWKADQVLHHERAYGGNLYLWIIPASAGGTWRWKSKIGAEEIAANLQLEQQFQALSGAVRLGQGADVRISEASLVGKAIKFTAAPTFAGKEVRILYQGTIEGDAIQGTQQWLSGPSAGTYPWSATREPLDLAGHWEISVPAAADRNGVLTIQRKEGVLTATFAAAGNPERETPIHHLYVWGASVRFELPPEEHTTVFSGSLAGDAGSGTVGATGAEKSMTWTAKRVQAKPAGAPAAG